MSHWYWLTPLLAINSHFGFVTPSVLIISLRLLLLLVYRRLRHTTISTLTSGHVTIFISNTIIAFGHRYYIS